MTTVIRASSLPGYTDCARRWAAQTLMSEINTLGFNLTKNMAKSVGASVGTATHGGAAYIMTEKMNSGQLGNQTEAEQRALDDFTTATQEGVLWDDATPNLNNAQKQVVRMVKTFRNSSAADLQPVAVERRLEARLGDDFMLSGQSDLQLLNPEGIDDLKTGRFPRQHYAQIGSYSLLARTAYPDVKVSQLRVNFIQRVAIDKPQPEPVIEVYDQPTAEQAAVNTITKIKSDVKEFRRRIEEEDAPPEHAFLANPASMLCSPKWCPAFGSSFCREHKR